MLKVKKDVAAIATNESYLLSFLEPACEANKICQGLRAKRALTYLTLRSTSSWVFS